MILDSRGRPISTNSPIRRGINCDGYELPNGAIISTRISNDFRQSIQNNTKLREALETAQRMTGKTLIALDMQRNSKGMDGATRETLVKNQEFGEKVMKKRVAEEKNLTESKKGYETIG